MNDISPIGRSTTANLGHVNGHGREQAIKGQPVRRADQAQFSRTAQLLSKLAELPAIDQNKVDQVRAQIAAGTYETPEKLEVALNEVIDDLIKTSKFT